MHNFNKKFYVNINNCNMLFFLINNNFWCVNPFNISIIITFYEHKKVSSRKKWWCNSIMVPLTGKPQSAFILAAVHMCWMTIFVNYMYVCMGKNLFLKYHRSFWKMWRCTLQFYTMFISLFQTQESIFHI